jgi:hypothetical protein
MSQIADILPIITRLRVMLMRLSQQARTIQGIERELDSGLADIGLLDIVGEHEAGEIGAMEFSSVSLKELLDDLNTALAAYAYVAPTTQYQLVTFVIGGNGTLSPLTGLHDANDTVNLTATPAEGYQVKQWGGTADDALLTNANTVVMSAYKVVVVAFEEEPA